MPINNGCMIMPRNSVYKTKTEFANIVPPNLADCGQSILFVVTSEYLNPIYNIYYPVQSGDMSLIDGYTGEILDTQSVGGGGTFSFTITNYTLFRVIYAKFLGVTGLYYESQSDNIVYSVIKALTTITSASSHNINHSIDGYVTFDFATTNIYVTLDGGTVDFRLYYDSVNFISLASTTIHANQATARIPANTMTSGNTYYLSALYLGSGCISPETNGLENGGFLINAT